MKQVLDAAGGCLFAVTAGFQHWPLFRLLDAATGVPRSPAEYMEAGRRNQTLRQLFNIKQGLSPADLLMRPRMAGRPPLPRGPLKGRSLPLEELVSGHWRHFGWDPETGVPLPETLAALGLPPPPEAAARVRPLRGPDDASASRDASAGTAGAARGG
jgi:aldehyde:ferredoxin oxidoreductase